MLMFNYVKLNEIVDSLLSHNQDLIRERYDLQFKLDEANEKIDSFKAAVKEMKAKAGIRGRGRPRKVKP